MSYKVFSYNHEELSRGYVTSCILAEIHIHVKKMPCTLCSFVTFQCFIIHWQSVEIMGYRDFFMLKWLGNVASPMSKNIAPSISTLWKGLNVNINNKQAPDQEDNDTSDTDTMLPGTFSHCTLHTTSGMIHYWYKEPRRVTRQPFAYHGIILDLDQMTSNIATHYSLYHRLPPFRTCTLLPSSS